MVVLLAGLATLIAAITSGTSPALVALAIVYAQRVSKLTFLLSLFDVVLYFNWKLEVALCPTQNVNY